MRYTITICIAVSALLAGRIMPRLRETMKSTASDQTIGVIVHLAEKPLRNTMPARTPEQKRELVAYLQASTARSQAEVLRDHPGLSAVEQFWVFNGFYCEATPAQIEELARDPRVDYIVEDKMPYNPLIEPMPSDAALPTTEWNITKIKADSVWIVYGITGAGRIIGAMDTGVDTSHPALKLGTTSKMAPGGWYDAVSGNPNPYWTGSHGTHVTGTEVGGDGTGPFTNDIGVAPGAKFIHALVIGGNYYYRDFHRGFQWVASLAGTAIEPDAVQNSWGWPVNEESLEYWDDILAWRNLNIIPTFSYGNESTGGPRTPASYPDLISVGATDASDNIANFSSLGPAPNSPPWNEPKYWSDPLWNTYTYPFYGPYVCAPGVSVRSCVPGGGYESWDGTSMAGPHVAGTIALMMEANPNLDYQTVWNILTSTAVHLGGTYPNNTYGWGRINAKAAVEAAMAIETDPFVTVFSYEITDPGGNNDSWWQRGELVGIIFTLHNSGADGNITANVSTTNPNITVMDGSTSFGNIPAGGFADNSGDPVWVKSDVNTPCGEYVRFDLVVTDGGRYTDTLIAYVNVDYGPGMIVDVYSVPTSVYYNQYVPQSITASPTSIYFTTQSNNRIYVINPATGDSVRTITGPATNLTGITYDRTRDALWVQSNAGTIYRIDTLGSQQASFSSPASTRADIAYDPVEDVLWVTSGTTVYKVDAATGSNLGSITCPVSGTVRGIAYEPRGGTNGTLILMVDKSSTKWFYEFSKTGTKLDSAKIAEVEATPRGMDYDPVDSVYYVIYGSSDSWYYATNEIRKQGSFYCPEAQVSAGETSKPLTLTLNGPSPSVTRDYFILSLILPTDQHVRITLYDATGRVIQSIHNGKLASGQHTFRVRTDVPSGVYFLRAEAGGATLNRKLVINR
ncbi:MAG: S8 family serine peptidase [candidate division WOR-3 bacterium]